MADIRVIPGDMREQLRVLRDDGVRVHSVVTDPPYHLTSIVQRFGAPDAAPINNADEKLGRNGPYHRASRGFMGKQWDGGDIAFQPETWRLCFDLLPPGGHLLAFAGTRTYHRMACAIEDAGFELRDTIAWLYGSGFPKSHNVSKGIDRAAGAEREVVGIHHRHGGGSPNSGSMAGPLGIDAKLPLTAPATDAARQWDGWGTALKPAMELICVARKPLIGTVAATVLAHGTGALNIDGCRIEGQPEPRGLATGLAATKFFSEGNHKLVDKQPHDLGRWPANTVHDGSAEVVKAFPDTTPSVAGVRNNNNQGHDGWSGGTFRSGPLYSGHGDSGSAARFFFSARQDAHCGLCHMPYDAACNASNAEQSSQIDGILRDDFALSNAADSQAHGSAARPNLSSDHANNAEGSLRECHQQSGNSAQSAAQTWPLPRIVQNVRAAANLCGSCATDIAHALAEVRQTGSAALSRSSFSIPDFKETILRQSLASYVASRESTDTILTTTSLSTLFGCVFHAIDESIRSAKAGSSESTRPDEKRLWYSSKADSSDRLGSKHPTVKPVDLMRWLVRLVTPPGGTVLDPFAGSGTTGMACMAEGFDCILIEREAEYVADIKARIAHVRGDDTPLFAVAADD